MRRLDLEELHAIQIGILDAFDKFCRQNEIEYSIGAGTMLGAVRHKGFIPWDDDVDIFMKRDQYNKFIDLIKERDYYFADHIYAKIPGQENHRYPFIKIIDDRTLVYEKNTIKEEMGVWADIFPIDYCGNTQESAVELAQRQKDVFNEYLEYLKLHETDSLINVLKNVYLMGYRIRHKNVRKKIFAYEQELASNPLSSYSGTLVWTQSIKDVYPTDYFEGYTELVFEDLKVMSFKQYDLILSHRYGDYMKLPPEDQRICHEPYAYLKEEYDLEGVINH